MSAHVDTATDYRIALRAGVDEMAHLPGYYIGLDDDPRKYELTERDARETAKRGTWVLQGLGVFTNLEMLKIWCEATPQAIFPHRRIGRFREGYEASFLVLNGNPLEDFSKVKSIHPRFKQGSQILPVSPSTH